LSETSRLVVRRAASVSRLTRNVIADTSPLQYAVEIDIADTLFMLYGRIVVPVAVASEMRHPGAPLLLRRWVEDNQNGIQVQSVRVPDDPRLRALDLGEREAIALAQKTLGSLLIIDDREGREEARRRGLRITGLLGVIRDAALRGYIDFDAAIQKLRNTDFRLSPEVEALTPRLLHGQTGLGLWTPPRRSVSPRL
jgi:predicted nucleic acid-binding protein